MPKETSRRSFGLPSFAHQSSLTLGLCCVCIDILSLTRVLFSDGDLDKSSWESDLLPDTENTL